MDRAKMDRLIGLHLKAEAADTAGGVSMYTDGVAGNGRRISFRLLHVWKLWDGPISRENVWLDVGSVVAQLTAGAGRAPSAAPHGGGCRSLAAPTYHVGSNERRAP